MRVLGVDTTTPGGSVALCDEDRLLGVVAGDPERTHGERLLRDIDSLLVRYGWRLQDIDLYGVAAGPGSFTGLRIGIATVQGLAMVHRRGVVGVSALDALARTASESVLASTQGQRGPFVAAWLDAHRGEVFSSLHTMSASEAGLVMSRVEGPSVEAPDSLLERWSREHPDRSAMFVGDGALRYRDRIGQMMQGRATVVPDVPPTAPAVASLALRAALGGEVGLPHAVRPLYVRRPDAELAREARARRSEQE
jgi:tRNA threonylcarbamoyladenosine biosynthesis protein TsaB